MSEREKVQKAFNQCTDALSNLDQKSVLKVFHLLSVQFDIVPESVNNSSDPNYVQTNGVLNYLPQSDTIDPPEIIEEVSKRDTKKANTGKKSKASSSKSPTYLSDFNFRPTGKESLKDFHGRYKVSTSMQNNLVFAYYLQEILNEQITENHIYSCYKYLGIKIPSFPSTLNDTKRIKGWIDTSNYDNIKVTRVGINFLEHEMAKNNGE